jgi:hypothetical protein
MEICPKVNKDSEMLNTVLRKLKVRMGCSVSLEIDQLINHQPIRGAQVAFAE